MNIYGKTCDCFDASLDGHDYQGYPMSELNITRFGDGISMSICADCGQVQDWEPIEVDILKKGDGDVF